jgi:hypothetical protein
MRMLMFIQLPLEPFNSKVRNGTAGPTMMKILEDVKPEASYFSERDGKRGGILVVNVNKPSDVPRLSEPWFLNFNASVELRICMGPQDLAESDLDALGKKWG